MGAESKVVSDPFSPTSGGCIKVESSIDIHLLHVCIYIYIYFILYLLYSYLYIFIYHSHKNLPSTNIQAIHSPSFWGVVSQPNLQQTGLNRPFSMDRLKGVDPLGWRARVQLGLDEKQLPKQNGEPMNGATEQLLFFFFFLGGGGVFSVVHIFFSFKQQFPLLVHFEPGFFLVGARKSVGEVETAVETAGTSSRMCWDEPPKYMFLRLQGSLYKLPWKLTWQRRITNF